ncbi:hypothetical protein [Actinomadura rugatobispora]|uniref:DUF4352 domain-containing protein n=1 Tax=Actinomadura rugatobispora TaxID=1994 RepID=A0ABW0ZMW8_9ACTN|nr:hypothetical protein GCM10010200_060660 [Actinomadura rugatobispora]
MPHPGSRPSTLTRSAGRGTALALAFALALTGCSGDDKKASGPKPPPPSEQPEAEATSAPGAQAFSAMTGLRKPVTYDDKVSVAITDIKYVKNKKLGPGEITGKTLTIFTLRFTNGSGQALDLNKVRVVAQYGKTRAQASPTSYANLNDFYGTVAAGRQRSASYAFDLPTAGYGSVVLNVAFSDKHKTAVFAGSLKQ